LKRHITHVQFAGKFRSGRNRKLRVESIAGFGIDEPFSATRTGKPHAQLAGYWSKSDASVDLTRCGTRRRPSALAALPPLSSLYALYALYALSKSRCRKD
jgi:hypothetical protein